MRTLAFDGRMGASGDMLLGALVAVGGDPAVLEPIADVLDVEYHVETVDSCGIEATDVSVHVTDAATPSDSVDHAGDHTHSHEHDGSGDTTHSHEHDHSHAEGNGPHRSYPEVVEIVESLDLPSGIEQDAKAIFELLGEAEASVHGTDLTETHFHEVGADDAIADVVGVALLLDDIDPDRIVTTPVATGGGTVEMSHGVYPVPTPAVVELAERADWSLQGGPLDTELLTPTGAAILAHVADGVEMLPTLSVEQSGYGVGGKSFEQHPNVLRALLGESTGGLRRDSITVLETNLDDATPETLGRLQETLLDAGARDVSILPATMKKSRPGHIVKVVVRPEDAERVARTLAAETGTLGIREHGAGHRFIADREQTTVTLDIDGESYEMTVKVGRFQDGEAFDVSGEYDDARAIAEETGLPVREVLFRAQRAYTEQ